MNEKFGGFLILKIFDREFRLSYVSNLTMIFSYPRSRVEGITQLASEKILLFERFTTNSVLHHQLDPQRDHMRVVTTFCTWLPYNKIFKKAISTMDFAVDNP